MSFKYLATLRLGLTMLLLGVLAPLRAQSPSPELVQSLGELEALYQNVLPWLSELYDPVSGGFYESIGLKRKLEPKDYGPDIQSTHFALSIIRQSDQFDKMPEAVKEKFIQYFLVRQDPESGYFIDLDYPEMRENQRVLGRALSFSTGRLRAFGREPLYPLPGQKRSVPQNRAVGASVTQKAPPPPVSEPSNPAPKTDAKAGNPPADNVYIVPRSSDMDLSNVPAHLSSVASFRQWMDERPWQHSWTAVDNIQSQTSLITGLPEPLRTEIINEAIRYISERQDPETGLLEGGDIGVRLSGAFKLVMFCRSMERPVPYAAQMQATVLEWLETESDSDRIFFIRNTCDMLAMLIRQTGNSLSQEQLVAVIRFATWELERFRQDDGAFCSFTFGFFVSPNDLYLGQNSIPAQAGPQSNLNATRMAMATRDALYGLAGEKAPDLTMAHFWEACLNNGNTDAKSNASALTPE